MANLCDRSVVFALALSLSPPLSFSIFSLYYSHLASLGIWAGVPPYPMPDFQSAHKFSQFFAGIWKADDSALMGLSGIIPCLLVSRLNKTRFVLNFGIMVLALYLYVKFLSRKC